MATKIIGLTGGIGSGKSTIAAYFMSLGVPVYIADEEAKKILYTPEAIKEVKGFFGEAVFTGDAPDRKKLSAVVFNNPEKLKVLNSIIHPKVREHFNQWVANYRNEKFVIKEAAILFESGSYTDCDKIILVTAPKEERIKRVMKRDKVTEQEVAKRMEHQWDDAEKIKRSDFIINNITLEKAKQQAKQIFNILKEM